MTDCLMINSFAECIISALFCGARIFTGLGLWVTVFVVRAVVVFYTFRFDSWYTISVAIEIVTQLYWTNTVSTFVNDETFF